MEPLRTIVQLLILCNEVCLKNNLIIDHSLGGGANLYRTRMIEEKINQNESVFLLNYNIYHKKTYLSFRYKAYENTFEITNNLDLLQLFRWIPVHEIFINNMVSYNETLSLLEIILKLKRLFNPDIVIAIHDYYCICPSYTLLNNKGQYCNLPGIKICESCIVDNKHINYPLVFNNISDWRRTWGKVINLADRILCFSESSMDLMIKTYPNSKKRILVKPHEPLIKFSKIYPVTDGSKLNIGIIGAIGYQKGSEIVIQVAKLLKEKTPDATITVIGRDRET
jgi:glycosyltransferase involved in cell wall biosynthesis